MRLAFVTIANVSLQNTPMNTLQVILHRGAGLNLHKINCFINVLKFCDYEKFK